MRPNVWFTMLFVLGSVLVGVMAYHAGVAHGLAGTGAMAAAGPAGPHVHGWGWHPWGVGFVFPFFFLFFWLFVIRAVLWGGPWRYGWHPRTGGGVPPMFDEWHRRAHERDGQRPAADRH